MTIQRDSNVHEFLAAAAELLYTQEAAYSLILGLVEGLAQNSIQVEMDPLFLRLVRDGRSEAALIQVRPSSCAVTALDADSAALFARHLTTLSAQQSFVGNRPGCALLAAQYAALTKQKTKTLMAQKILSAERVVPPRPVTGTMRMATAADQNLAFDFIRAFHRECIPHDPFHADRMRQWTADRIGNGQVYLWTVEGRPMAMAHSSRPTRHTISINAVFTAAGARGRGYASNLMAKLTQFLLDTGKRQCVLYTDAANPTSNKIYESVGYRAVAESEHIGVF